eukprot:GEMP01016861.1.p1 GENE.GEMP01016861.1~~GEMP01016861.1.p1  ORF type:complete len:589 (+),score=193.77 GEMP01016861.1:132-1898(+)
MPTTTPMPRTFTRSVICSEPNCPVCVELQSLTKLPPPPPRPTSTPMKSMPSDVDLTDTRDEARVFASSSESIVERTNGSLHHAKTSEKIAAPRTRDSATQHSDNNDSAILSEKDSTSAALRIGVCSHMDSMTSEGVAVAPPSRARHTKDTGEPARPTREEGVASPSARRHSAPQGAPQQNEEWAVPGRFTREEEVNVVTRVVAPPSVRRYSASQGAPRQDEVWAARGPSRASTSHNARHGGAKEDDGAPHVTTEEANLLRRLHEELPISRAQCQAPTSPWLGTPKDSQNVRDAMIQYGRIHRAKITRKTKDGDVHYLIGDVVTKVKLVDGALLFRLQGTTTWQASHEFDPRPLSARTAPSAAGSSLPIRPSSPTATPPYSPTTTQASNHDAHAARQRVASSASHARHVGDPRRAPQHSTYTIFGHPDPSTDDHIMRPRFVLTTVQKPPPVIRLSVSPPPTKRLSSVSAPRMFPTTSSQTPSISRVSSLFGTTARGSQGARLTAQSSASQGVFSGGSMPHPFGQRLSLLPIGPAGSSDMLPRALGFRDLNGSQETVSSPQSRVSQPIDRPKPVARESWAGQWQYCSVTM